MLLKGSIESRKVYDVTLGNVEEDPASSLTYIKLIISSYNALYERKEKYHCGCSTEDLVIYFITHDQLTNYKSRKSLKMFYVFGTYPYQAMIDIRWIITLMF